MNDTTKEQNGKNPKTNNLVCITLRLTGSRNLVNLTFNLPKILLPKYFIFLSKQKHADKF